MSSSDSPSGSTAMYKIEKKDKRLFVNAGASLRGLFTRRSKRSKKRDIAEDGASQVFHYNMSGFGGDRKPVSGGGVVLSLSYRSAAELRCSSYCLRVLVALHHQ